MRDLLMANSVAAPIKVFVNGGPHYEHQLKNGDRITIGASTLRLNSAPKSAHTMCATTTSLWAILNGVSANDVMETVLHKSAEIYHFATTSQSRDKCSKHCNEKQNILSALTR